MDITEIRNEFEQQLIDRGYKFFADNWKNSLRGIQKRFIDEKGVKYFITGYHYNMGEQFPHKNAPNADKYTFTAQFRVDENTKDKTIDVDFSADFLPNEYREVTGVEEMEDFFEQMFVNIKAEYYELNTY